MKKQFWILLCAALVLAIIPQLSTVNAAAGDIDMTFGSSGAVVTDLGGFDVGGELVVDDNGRIVVGGSTFGANTNIVLVRYLAGGALDSSFGTGGIVTTNLSSMDIFRGLARQSDGKLVVAGSTELNGNKDFLLVRYNSDGTLDDTFDGDGVVVTAVSAGEDTLSDIVLQNDGKIVVVGQSQSKIAVARYLGSGAPDTGFGTNGLVLSDDGSAEGAAIQADGKIVVGGRSLSQFAVLRLDATGAPDAAFGVDGIVTTPVGNNSFVSGWDVAIQPDGKIILAGAGAQSTDLDLAVVRYTGEGVLDTTFGSNGIFFFDSGSGNDEGLGMILESSGNILVTGYTPAGILLLNLQPDGELNTDFSGDGYLVTALGERGQGLALQADRRIVVNGYGSTDFVTIRFEGNPALLLDQFVFLPFIEK